MQRVTICHNPCAIPVLTYHQIAQPSTARIPYRDHIYVHPDDFAKQMRLLDRLGYGGMSLSDLQPYLQGERKGRVVGITFDDGYLSTLTQAMPVLKAYGFTATSYAVSQLIGQTNEWDHPLARAKLMNTTELKQWLMMGNDVGAHTRRHLALGALSNTDADAEIAQCKVELEAMLGAEIKHFCFPYGQYQPQHVHMAQEAGYSTAVSTVRGRCLAGSKLMELPRIAVLGTTSLLAFQLKVATPYDDRPHPIAWMRRGLEWLSKPVDLAVRRH
jgi:peptidoglycan/xylan/chitin deacetylase (PgdA/CDA1 family)